MPLAFQFDTLNLRLICEDQAVAESALGDGSELLFAALADLRAVSNLAELPDGLFCSDPRACGTFFIIAGDHRVSFCQNHKKVPLNQEGQLDLQRVIRIKIIGIEHND